MDRNLLGQYDSKVSNTNNPPFPSVTADPGNGTIAHQMITYWYTGASEYTYYFLYETLDTTLTVNSPGVTVFSAKDADLGAYAGGALVSYNGKVYVYSQKETSSQKSTAVRNGQNQPAKQGYNSDGRLFCGAGDQKPDDSTSHNIYFFYSRESFELTIQNINQPYTLPQELLTTTFSCLDQYVTGAETLQQLGWYYDAEKQAICLRYGAWLSPLNDSEILSWLTSADRGQEVLAYPFPSDSENQYYFIHWFRNSQQTVRVDWQENDFRNIHANVTLYAGWFTPRYTTSYVLNGGTWQDSGNDAIQYTLITTRTDDGQNLYFYYPHQTTDPEATVYWYVQSVETDRLYVDTLYTCTIRDVLVKDETTGHWKLNTPLDLVQLRRVSTEDTTGTRLVDRYFCYMGNNGLDEANGHTKYVNINSSLNTVLPEPAAPTRSGYAFVGWYYFDNPTSTEEKVYLKDVLSAGQSLDSYDVHYVYLNSVGDAFLLEKDAQGELFYYPSQTGYRFNYSNNASLVSKTRELYAAWESTSDARAVVYQLIRADQADEAGGALTPKGESSISLTGLPTITIGSTEYLVLHTDATSYNNLYTGSTQMLTAWEYCVGGQSRKWLPQYASIPLQIDQSTPTVANENDLSTVTGNTYRIQDRDADGNLLDSYTYYAFFVYEPSQEVSYNVYAIDLSVAVAEGALSGYQDAFDRADPPQENTPYVLQMEQKSWQADTDSGQQAVVYENAPAISGYSVYSEWSQSLQLQTTAGTNNLYFYYIKDGSLLSYSMTYYLMTEGAYSPEDTLTITGIPAVRGEILSLQDLIDRCGQLLEQAVTYRSYAGSEQSAQKMLYERYRNMTVTLTRAGTSQTFTVDSGGASTLDPQAFQQTLGEYYLDQWSPSGDTLVVSDDTTIDVYLGRAELTVQKESTDGRPLAGARFTLVPLVEDSAGTYHYGDATYRVADTTPLEAVSGADGRAVFMDLSAQTGQLYLLTEVEAPAGYNKLQEPVIVAVPYAAEGQEPSYQVTYTVVNSGISYLPKAGVAGGIYGTVLLGGGMMAAAVFYLIVLVLLRRRKHRRTKQL